MMPWGWERRNKDAARVVGLICSSAAAAGPGFELKGVLKGTSALLWHCAPHIADRRAPRPNPSGNTPTAVLLLDLEDDGQVEPSAGG